MSFTSRCVVAFLIDFLLISIVAIIIVMMLDVASILSKAARKIDSLLNGRIGFLAPEELIRGFIAFVLLMFKDWLFFSGGSIGKQLMKIKVVKLDGSRLTLLDCVKRTLPCAILPVETYFVLTGQDRLGDRWAGTDVVPGDYKPENSENEE